MGTPKYDNFEFAVLRDALFTAEEKARAHSLSSVEIETVFRELAHVLEVLCEREAANSCRFIVGQVDYTDWELKYDELLEKVDTVLAHFDFDYDEKDLEKLAEKAMLIPEPYSEREVLEIIAAHEASEESEG